MAARANHASLVSGPVSIPDPAGVKTIHVESAREMQAAVEKLLPADAALRIGSACMLPRNARPSPPAALAAAARRGVDLAGHRSQHAWAETVAQAAVILIFDQVNRRSFEARYPELRERVFLLSALDNAGSETEIADPDGKSEAFFASTYERIDRCTERLARLVAEH